MKKNLKVGYRNYNIKVLDSVMAKVNELHGQFLTSEGVIALSSAEDSVSHANTFIHEILHTSTKEGEPSCPISCETGCSLVESSHAYDFGTNRQLKQVLNKFTASDLPQV